MVARNLAVLASVVATLTVAAAPAYAVEEDFSVSARVSCFDASTGARAVDWVVTSHLDVEGLLIYGLSDQGHFYSPDGARIAPHGSVKANSYFDSAPSDGRVEARFGIQRMDNPGYTEYFYPSADVTHACDFSGHVTFTSKCDKSLVVDITANASNPASGPFRVTWNGGDRTVTLGPGASARVTLTGAQVSDVTVYAGTARLAAGSWRDPGCLYPTEPDPGSGSDPGNSGGAGGGGSHGGSDAEPGGGSDPGSTADQQGGAVGVASHRPTPSSRASASTSTSNTVSPTTAAALTPGQALTGSSAVDHATPILPLLAGLAGSVLVLALAVFLVARRGRSSPVDAD